MTVKPRGIRSPIPAGNLIGRGRGKGTGAATLVSVADLAQQIMTNGVVAPPGAPSPLLPIVNGDILANISGASAAPVANTVTSVLDYVFSSTQGDILYRDSAAWKALAYGTSGQSLLSGGSAANPSWSYPNAGTLLGTTLASTVVTSSLTTVGTIGTGVWQGTLVGVTYGGTGANLSATGGASQVLKQVTAGAAVTVGQLAASDLSNGTTGSGAVVLATSPSLTTPSLGVATATSINKVTITAPATGSTLTIADGKTLTDTSGVGADLLLGATGGGFAAYGGTSGAASQWITALSAAGVGTFAQPAFTDISGTITATQGGVFTGTANAFMTGGGSNTAPNFTAVTGLVLGNGASAPTAYGGTSGAAHQWITALSAAGAGTFAQPATTDLSDIGTFNLSTTGTGALASLAITGTSGAGYIDLVNQPGSPTVGTPASGHIRIYGQGGGSGKDFAFTNSTGTVFRISLNNLSASTTYQYQFPSANPTGTITLIGNQDTGTVTNTMLANSSLTVGSTNIALGATSTTLAGLTSITATGGSLTGLSALSVTAPAANTDGLDISGLSLTGSAANAGLSIAGTWNTTGAPAAILVNMTNTASGSGTTLLDLQIGGVNQFYVAGPAANTSMFLGVANAGASTGTLQGANFSSTFSPAGASLSNVDGFIAAPSITGSALAISNFYGNYTQLKTTSGFTGTVTTALTYYAANPSVAGANPFTNYYAYTAAPITNGSGLTSGSVTNQGLYIEAPTAVAGVGGTITNNSITVGLASGTNAGTATNRAIYITGNGQTGGTVTNWAIYSSSTANSQITGGLNSTPIGATTASTGAFTTLKANATTVSPTNTSMSTPTNPTGTTSTTGVMMGLAGSITPKATAGSGNVLITICGDCFNATAIADGGKIQIRAGTGTAPANAATLTGTTYGAQITFVQATTADKYPFNLTAVATGLTLGTAYWIDVGLAALTGGTATIENVTVTAVEI